MRFLDRVSRYVLITLLLLLSTVVSAQTVTAASTLQWTLVGQGFATSQSAVYKAYVDATTTGVTLTTVTCVAGVPTSNAACTSAMPALTPGTHTLVITQSIGTAESPKSNAASVTFTVVVTPSNLTAVP
jgi:hypothetical protein